MYLFIRYLWSAKCQILGQVQASGNTKNKEKPFFSVIRRVGGSTETCTMAHTVQVQRVLRKGLGEVPPELWSRVSRGQPTTMWDKDTQARVRRGRHRSEKPCALCMRATVCACVPVMARGGRACSHRKWRVRVGIPRGLYQSAWAAITKYWTRGLRLNQQKVFTHSVEARSLRSRCRRV